MSTTRTDQVATMFNHDKSWTAVDLAKALDMRRDALGHHLTKLRKKGVIYRDGNVWSKHEGEDKPKAPVKKKAKQEEPSIRLLILAAQEGLDLALVKLDALENALLGNGEK